MRETCCPDAQRVELLEAVIREAVSKLEETKKSFKSKKVKEVREKLLSVIHGWSMREQGRFTGRQTAEQ